MIGNRAMALGLAVGIAALAMWQKPAAAAETFEPIMLAANQTCGCSPADTYMASSPAVGWTLVDGPVTPISPTPTMAPAAAPWVQSTRQNVAVNGVPLERSLSPVVLPVQLWKPVVTAAGPMPAANYRIGKGLIGQPKVYVPGQPIRNLVRYLSP